MALMEVPLQAALRQANIEDRGERERAIRAIEIYVEWLARRERSNMPAVGERQQ